VTAHPVYTIDRNVMDGRNMRSSYAVNAIDRAHHGAHRRNEILGVQWDDLNLAEKKLRIERAVQETKKHGLRLKAPKTARGKRTIRIDDALLSMLVAERERYLRIAAGVPDGATVDLSLVKLPAAALMFPHVPLKSENFSFTRLRSPRPPDARRAT
jgi:integrase